MSEKSERRMMYIHMFLKLATIGILVAILLKVDEIYRVKVKKEGYDQKFNTQRARPQTREKFSVMKPEMDQCMAACKANDWTAAGSDLSPDAQCELQCSHLVNYSPDSPCFVDMSKYPTL